MPRPVVDLDDAGWLQRLGPPRGHDDSIDVEGTWDTAALNAGAAALAEYGFPAVTLDDLANAERQLSASTWTDEEGRAALASTHGPTKAARMIDSAQVALELIAEHPLGRDRIASWQARGGFCNPYLVEALANLLDRQPKDSDKYLDLCLRRAAKWQARRRGQP